MSLFEFVTVMVSMILALTLGQLLRSVSSLAKKRRQVVPYAPHSLWLICIFLTLINHWWSLWDLRDINWTYVAFLYTLLGPTLVNFMVGLITHDQSGDGTIDLKMQFNVVRPLFMTIEMGYVIALWFDGPLLAGQDPFGLVGLMHIPILGAVTAGLLTEGRRVQVAVPVIITAALIVIMVRRALF